MWKGCAPSLHQIEFSPQIAEILVRHAEFIARVSVPAARCFRQEFAAVMQRLEQAPLQFPPYDDERLPEGVYRKAVFAKWYKVVFSIEGMTVHVDAVVDGRQKG